MLGLGVQRAVDRHDIAHLDHRLHVRVIGEAEFFFDRFGQAMPVHVMQFHVEGLQAPQHGKTNAARRDCADIHTFKVIGTLDAVRDVPPAFHDPLIRWDVVAHER